MTPDMLTLTYMRYYDPVVQWPNREWYLLWPTGYGAPKNSVTTEVTRYINAGYARIDTERGYPCARLTNKGHMLLDNSATLYSLPPGLHMLPDEQLFTRPKVGAKVKPELHEEFVVAIGNARLINAIQGGAEVYIGMLPNAVEPGDLVLVADLGDLHSSRLVVVSRMYNGHACVVKTPIDIPSVYHGSMRGKSRVINPVGIWHLDVKPIMQPLSLALNAQLGWGNGSWVMHIQHPTQPEVSVANRVISPAQLASDLTQVCRTPVTVQPYDGDLVIRGAQLNHAHHIYWVLRQAYRYHSGHESGHARIIDWMFDDTTALRVGHPTRQRVLHQRGAL